MDLIYAKKGGAINNNHYATTENKIYLQYNNHKPLLYPDIYHKISKKKDWLLKPRVF